MQKPVGRRLEPHERKISTPRQKLSTRPRFRPTKPSLLQRISPIALADCLPAPRLPCPPTCRLSIPDSRRNYSLQCTEVFSEPGPNPANRLYFSHLLRARLRGLPTAMTTMASNSLLPARRISSHTNGFFAVRSAAVGLARILSMTLSTAYAAPLGIQSRRHGGVGDDEPDAEGASLWVLYAASVFLVLSGGAFAGLTIA